MELTTCFETRPLKKLILSEYRYNMVQERLYHIDLGEYNTYGIQVTLPDYTHIIHDVSACKETVENIVGLLNSNQVSHIHLYDVIIDILSC